MLSLKASQGKSSSRDISTIESCERERENSYNSCIFFSVFNIISPFHPVNVALLSNHVKSGVLMFYGDLSRLLTSGRSSTLPLPSLQPGVSLLLYQR